MRTIDPDSRLQVVVGVIRRNAAGDTSEYLIQQRPVGKICAGQWEFPGGKIEQGESPSEALNRELHEELGIDCQSMRFLKQIDHDYSHANVSLQVYLIDRIGGNPVAREGQVLCWDSVAAIRDMEVLEAVLPILDLLESIGQPESPVAADHNV